MNFFFNLRYHFPQKICLSICHVLMFSLPKKSCHQKILLNITVTFTLLVKKLANLCIEVTLGKFYYLSICLKKSQWSRVILSSKFYLTVVNERKYKRLHNLHQSKQNLSLTPNFMSILIDLNQRNFFGIFFGQMICYHMLDKT